MHLFQSGDGTAKEAEAPAAAETTPPPAYSPPDETKVVENNTKEADAKETPNHCGAEKLQTQVSITP